VRALTWLLAWVHSFPALKHLRALVITPSLSEAYKGIGAAVAVILYLAPTEWQARMLGRLWQRRHSVLTLASLVLVATHAVPALDHVPKFFDDPTWADAWRGFGAAFAVLWFTVPTPMQARAIGVLARSAQNWRFARRLVSDFASRVVTRMSHVPSVRDR
jgi:hypothetical protein